MIDNKKLNSQTLKLASIVSSNMKDAGILLIDSDGVCLEDARKYDEDCWSKIVKYSNVKPNITSRPTITKKFWFYIDDTEFYSFNDVEFCPVIDKEITQTKGV